MQLFRQPEICKGFRNKAAKVGLGFKGLIDLRFYSNALSRPCSHFEFDRLGLIPVIIETMGIPKFSDLLVRTRF